MSQYFQRHHVAVFFINWEKSSTKQTTHSTSITTQKTTAMNVPSSTSQIIETTENMVTYIPQMTSNYIIVVNTTVKQTTTNQNRVFLFFIISILVISTCVGVSYCILLGCTHYLDGKLPTDESVIDLKRASLVSYDSNTNACPTMNSRPSTVANPQRKQLKHLSTDSLPLFCC